MRKLAFALLASSAIGGGSAVAADMPIVAAPEAAVVTGHDWSGFYIGAHIGYGLGDRGFTAFSTDTEFPGLFAGSDVVDETGAVVAPALDPEVFADDALDFLVGDGLIGLGPGGEFDIADDDDIEGVLGGAQIGFNFQSGSWVFGIEGDFSATDISADTAFSIESADFGVDDGAALSADLSTEIDWLSTVRGRVGVAFDSVLVFASGGAAIADVNVDGSLTAALSDGGGAITSATTSFSESDTRLGYTVGGGVEVALNENWSIKGEYQYIDLGEETIDLDDDSGVDVDIDLHVVKFGVNYSF